MNSDVNSEMVVKC